MIYANSIVAEEIALENKEKQLRMLKQNQTNNRSVQMDKTGKDEKSHTSHTHTREQVAKMSGVGTVTVARYDAIYNSDNEVLLDLLESNIRRRGEIGGSAKKVGKRIKELERIYGVEHGGNRKSSPKVSDLNQSDIAEMIGISVDTLNNYKKLTELIPELKENVVQEKMRKILLDKLGKWCYDSTNDKDYKSCQLQLSNK